MSFSDLDVKGQTQGNGVAVNFAIPFHYQDEDEIEVWLRDETDPDNITETQMVEGALQDYTLTGATPPTTPLSTTVTFNTAPVADTYVHIRRVVAMTQPTSTGTTISSATHGRVWDRIVMQIQQVWEYVNRAPRFQKTFTGTVPEFTETEADTLLMYSPDGTQIIPGPTIDEIDAAVAAAAASAAASADQAATSAAEAAASAASAEGAAASAVAAAASADTAEAAAQAAQAALASMVAMAPSVTGTYDAPSALTTALAFVGTAWKNTWFVQGDGSDQTLSDNPRVAAGTNVGQELDIIVPHSATYKVTIPDGNGMNVNGPAILSPGDSLSLKWSGSVWFETGRR